MSDKGWIGVDLDGTLAHYDGWQGEDHIGEPIAPMLARVKDWINDGIEVRIFTARAYNDSTAWDNRALDASGMCPEPMNRKEAIKVVENWCLLHIGKILPVTCTKDFQMIQLWDDRCIQVVSNTGQRVDGIL